LGAVGCEGTETFCINGWILDERRLGLAELVAGGWILEERRLGLAELVAGYWRRGDWAWLNWWLDIGGEKAGHG
jgi:hypothetical protein